MLIALRILAGLTLGVVIIAGLLYYATVVNLTEHLVDADTFIVPLSENDAYNRIYDEVLADEELTYGLLGGVEISGHTLGDPVAVLREVMPPEYLQGQTEANIDRVTAYLRSESDVMEVYLELAQPIERVEPAVLAEIDRVVDEVEAVEVLDIGCAEFEKNREELAAAFAEMLTEFGEGMLPSTISPIPTLAQFCSEDGFKTLFDETEIDLAMDPETVQQMDDIWQAVQEPLEVVVDQINELLKELPGQLQKRLESAEDLTEPERESLEVALKSLQRTGGVLQPVGELSSSGRLAGKHITENTLEEIASSLEKASRDTAKELARPAVIPHIREAVRGLRMELEPGDRLDLIKLASENSEDLTREDIEASASELRSILSAARGPAKILSLTAVALGVLLIAALGLPRPMWILLWPGVAMLLGGVIALVTGSMLSSSVSGLPQELLALGADVPGPVLELGRDVLESLAQQSTAGYASAAVIAVMVLGAMLIAASAIVKFRFPGLSLSESATATATATAREVEGGVH